MGHRIGFFPFDSQSKVRIVHCWADPMNASSHLMRYDAKVNMMKVLNIFRPFEFCVSCRYFSQHLDSSPKMYFFDYVYTRILVRFRSFSHFIHLSPVVDPLGCIFTFVSYLFLFAFQLCTGFICFICRFICVDVVRNNILGMSIQIHWEISSSGTFSTFKSIFYCKFISHLTFMSEPKFIADINYSDRSDARQFDLKILFHQDKCLKEARKIINLSRWFCLILLWFWFAI